ncbi:hypothetical protein GCK32_021622 [Trichostrongylus colubriformis]|uniref:Uncharacterized protein n=1 Tax=Trichostrongylus colubriformis TaxID=6319 RepID=A0AAN8IAE4_TRICO
MLVGSISLKCSRRFSQILKTRSTSMLNPVFPFMGGARLIIHSFFSFLNFLCFEAHH